MKEFVIILFVIWLIMMCIRFYLYFIKPTLIKKTTKEIEKNPKWLTPVIRSQYYGLNDIDIILVENEKFNIDPRMRVAKDGKHLELLISSDLVNTNNIDDVAKILLLGKLCIKIGPQFGELLANKPNYWLSILNYMLDGGDINQSAVSWKEK